MRENNNDIGGGVKREQGLSEVIGFLMIVSLLAILFSMYLLYVVPLQGRDAEIAHMDNVKDQFLGIKTDIDSLILNRQDIMTLERTIPLGITGSSGSGAFSLMPLDSFIGSGGELQTYQAGHGTMKIEVTNAILQSNNVITNPNSYVTTDTGSSGSIIFNYSPTNFFIYYKTTQIPPSPTRIIISSNSTYCNNWTAILNAIPQYHVSDEDITNMTKSEKQVSYPSILYDLFISVLKGTHSTVNNLTIYSNIKTDTNYTVDLYDPTYGIMDCLDPYMSITIDSNTPINISNPSISQKYYITTEPIIIKTYQISGLSYSSNNNYWVNQEVEYEWGAIFLKQDTGTSILVRPPISIQDNDDYISVNLNNIMIENSDMVSGSLDIPVYTSLSSISQLTNGGFPLSTNPPNADSIKITYTGTTETEAKKWYEAFYQCKVNAGTSLKNHITVSISGDETSIEIVKLTRNLFIDLKNADINMAFEKGSS